MLELLAAGVVGALGHVKSKQFVRKKLRFTSLVEKPGVGLAAGAVTTLGVGVVGTILPFIAPAFVIIAAIGAGLGVGTGVAVGVRQAKDGWTEPDEF